MLQCALWETELQELSLRIKQRCPGGYTAFYERFDEHIIVSHLRLRHLKFVLHSIKVGRDGAMEIPTGTESTCTTCN